jgi:hypothetical protein
MSDTAKQARAAMKSKAQRLGSSRPLEKVDSSTWTPPELLNSQAKTGMRPVSRRQFKKGGKVVGECAPVRADRKPRKSGGKAEMPIVDRYINRDVKKANEFRDGVKHVGGMKKGGRAGREDGGKVADYDTGSRTGAGAVTQSRSKPASTSVPLPPRRPPEPDYDTGSRTGAGAVTMDRKSGGRTKKMVGGPMMGAQQMMDRAAAVSDVPSATMNFSGVRKGALSPIRGLKTGGKAKHEDVAADKALIKKMVKPSARTGKMGGGLTSLLGGVGAGAIADSMKDDDKDGKKRGGRTGRATGGQVFSGPGYPGKVPGVVPGGRTAHAAGGKAKGKGKTAINIVINAGKPAGQDGMMPPPPPGGPGKPPGAMPVAVPPPGAMPPGAGAPMPMPPGLAGAGGPPGMPPMPPGGMPPMGRKRGGRTYRSYKDMDAGAGGGEGRLEKTEIAAHKRSERKAGGRTYRSYKDMDAGSGGGLGRIEKAEIASHKSHIDPQNY